MSCSPYDVRDYFLKELTDPQQRQMEAHIKTCQACREEVERLGLTEAALLSLRDEEIPQRIAFVSDKVFEPSPWRRWWARFWGSAAQLGFASAAMLSTALVVFAFTRPAPAPVVNIAPARPTAAAAAMVGEGDMQQRIQAAVDRAVAQNEARDTQKTKALMAELVQARQQLQLAADEYDLYQKRANRVRVYASNYAMPPGDPGDAK